MNFSGGGERVISKQLVCPEITESSRKWAVLSRQVVNSKDFEDCENAMSEKWKGKSENGNFPG
jgi:hypothetical protein